jgi:hypothetical protein
VPIAVLPCVADALAAHPAYRDSVERLRGMGMRFGEPYAGEPGEDGRRPEFAWERALDLVGHGWRPDPGSDGDDPSGSLWGRAFECTRARTLPVETLRRQEQHRCST